MELEKQFFRNFFLFFLIGLTLSVIILITISLYFTGNYLDKKSSDNLVELIKDYSKININSINDIVSTLLLKMQISLSELIISYQNIANKLISNNTNLTRVINNDFLICIDDVNETYNINNTKTDGIAIWFIDEKTNLTNLKDNSTEQNQLIAISNIIQNIYSTFYANNANAKNFYFYFEITELFVAFPLLYYLEDDLIPALINFTNNPVWCTDKNGEKYTIYKARCRGWYNNIKKAKSDVFDINYKDNENRTIFVTEFYLQLGIINEIIFTFCIEFNDPISNKPAYICTDVISTDIYYNLDNINSKLSGYFFLNSVGFAQSFYFPGNSEEALTNTENIYRKDKKFFLEEKTHFSNNIQRLLSSNYIKQINNNSNTSLNEEVFTNGENTNDQVFYLNKEEYHFSIYPIFLENFNGNKEHVLNIILIYDTNSFNNEIKVNLKKENVIMVEVAVLVFLIPSLLYLIVKSFNYLSKYIVIPVKNVNYMLKGINIGGKNRLQYLYFLQRKQDENIEILEKMNIKDNKSNKNEDEPDINLIEENKENGGVDEVNNKKN